MSVASGPLPSAAALDDAMRRGQEALAEGDVPAALRWFRRGARVKASYGPAWVGQGKALARLGAWEEAAAAFREAATRTPLDADVWTGMADVQERLGHLEEALEAWERALRADPHREAAWLRRGLALHALGRYADALACYEHVLLRRPECTAALNNKGAALLRLGRPEEALDVFEEALFHEPTHADAHANRVLALHVLGRPAEVAAAADEALARSPNAAVLFLKGLAHAVMEEADRAAEAFEAAVALEPRFRAAREQRRAVRREGGRNRDRGPYGCFGTYETDDAGCASCSVRRDCAEVSQRLSHP